MRRRDLLRIIALTPLAGPLRGLAPSAVAGSNAADAYRAAIAALPALGPIDDRPSLRGAWLVRRAGRALDALARAAKVGECDWGRAWVAEGFGRSMAISEGARGLARLATLRARIAFDSGRDPRGMDDVVAVLTMGRHVGQGATMIAQLVGFAIEQVAIGVGSGPLPRLGPASLRALAARVDALPASVGLAEAVRAERAYFFGNTVPAAPEAYPSARAAHFAAFYDRLIDAVGAEDGPALAAIRDDPALDPEAAAFFQTFPSFGVAAAMTDVHRALFRAAIEVAADGPGALGRVVDPSDGLPFELQPREAGFVLASRGPIQLPQGPPPRPARLIVGAA